MQDIVRTPIGNYIQTCAHVGVKPKAIPHTTLNQLFGVNNNAVLNNNDVLAMRYVHIGIGGHENYVNSDGISVSRLNKHHKTDAGLWKPLPFAVRPVGNDLSDTERRNLALREERIINGQSYFLYWLRRQDTESIDVDMTYVANRNGVEQPGVPYVPVEAKLRPTPPENTGTGTTVATGDKIEVIAPMVVSFSATQIQELLNSARIMYGSESAAIISEIALCSGADRTMQVSSGTGGQITHNEAIHVQINSFGSVKLEMQFSSRKVDIEIDVGSSEPVVDL